MTVAAGAIVPHAPLLSIDRSPDDPMRSSIDAIVEALEAINFDGCDALVLLSPHGGATGVYREVFGSLDGFGRRGADVKAGTDTELAGAIASAWDLPLLEGPVDHGITGLLLAAGFPGVPVVAVAFAEISGPTPTGDVAAVVGDARRLARALDRLDAGRTLAVVASAHTSAALSPLAPLADRREGHELDARILAAVESDVGDLARIEPELWEAGGSCGAAPLTAFGSSFAGERCEILAYGAPAGVGYLVASLR